MPGTNDQPARRRERPEARHVLVVACDAHRRAWLRSALRHSELALSDADSASEALAALAKYDGASTSGSSFDAVVLDVHACTPATIKLVQALSKKHVPTVVICADCSFDEACAVLEAGDEACLLSADVTPKELVRTLRGALDQHPTAHKSRPSKSGTQPMATNVNTEFTRLIENELDVETLLRHALEFVLAKLGPTNAAVFLPGSTGEYALGAYVNLSCPKDAAEVMLDQLANIAAPRLEKTVGIIDIASDTKLRDLIGDGAEWLGGQRVMAFACRQENECLGVFMIFRDKAQPFPFETTAILTAIRDLFGQQLARVIRIHHRHLPRDKWGALGDGWESTGDEEDLAA